MGLDSKLIRTVIVKGCNGIKESTKYSPYLVVSEPAGVERVSSITGTDRTNEVNR